MKTYEILRYEEIDSTNVEAERLAVDGVRDGTVIVADRQTAGKGRRGRTWESEEGNLYFSILLRPDFLPVKAPMVTLVMAYSVAKAVSYFLESFELGDNSGKDEFQVAIKWPNDVILNRRKICGILTEMHLDGEQIRDIVIGVGVNVNGRDFSEELQDKATSLACELNLRVDETKLLHMILDEFRQQYAIFVNTQDLSFMQDEYNAMLVNCGKAVRVLSPEQEYDGVALGIDEQGELLVRKENGSVEAVYAGEVSVRGIYGYV